ncbi:class I SAM-dependent methyltransferase [Nonomuraea zeae]|uniref:Class I SAM-dependent methyltransferase n=1 Tax=Nonomuraea zeae TaxID=1642303 RepID=A0A5S4GW61_9ACTN|nr:class I SAM-dependent methyltransferase [Nonomuraea zeae]TMR36972.1 class I SAM-dependent methyltransferase [Nonomuraea zeae]
MMLLGPDGTWVSVPSSRVTVLGRGDLVVIQGGAETVISGALTASHELTAAGYAGLLECGVISTFFATDTYFPAMCSRWEARHVLAVLQPRFASPDGDSRVLDVCAGPGRLSLHVLEAGHQLDAIDISEEALDQLRYKAAGAGLSSRLSTFVVDAANFARPDHYAFAYCAANSIKYLGSMSRVQRHLRMIYRSLRAGGAYLIHVGLSVRPGSVTWRGADGRRVDWTVEEPDPRTSEAVERVRVTGPKSASEHVQVQVLLHGADLTAMAEAAGFAIGAMWGEDFTRVPKGELSSSTGNVWALLQK